MDANQLLTHRLTLAGSIRSAFDSLFDWASNPNQPFTATQESVGRLLALAAEIEPDAPADFLALQAVAAAMHPAWDAWAESDRPDRALPAEPFWSGLADLPPVILALAYPPPRPLEPLSEAVETLRASGIPTWRNQIVRMFNFIDADGRAHPEWIDRELAEPGSITGEKNAVGWVHPAARRQAPAIAAEESRLRATIAMCGKKRDRVAPLGESGDVGAFKRQSQPRERPGESLKELVEQGLTRGQISRMLRISVEDVLRRCAEQGLREPPMADGSVYATRSWAEGQLSPEDDATLSRQLQFRTRREPAEA